MYVQHTISEMNPLIEKCNEDEPASRRLLKIHFYFVILYQNRTQRRRNETKIRWLLSEKKVLSK